ncbi:hypothetical protein AB4Y64_05605 [Lysobacter sp. TAF61]|uniref:M61 family metallopeptidase n=1 Tax=Lysobacter sp. TAF61 TaxID=3233072 RepID=UPI003F973C65
MHSKLLLLLALLVATPATADDSGAVVGEPAPSTRVLQADGNSLHVEVLDTADPARVDELQRWLAEAAAATLTAFGRYPLDDATVRITQIDSDDESPVPWGQTQRGEGDVAVLLFVRRDAHLAELRDDWTAVHELSHLFHPYLGREGRWLAEGLASYYQNVLRARAGLLSPEAAWQELDAGFGRGQREHSGMPLDGLGRRGTMRVYWAGAAFWLEADLALRREHRSSLDAVLSKYSRCCLHGTGEVAPEAFMAKLDELAGAAVFLPAYRRYAQSREFPSLDAAYAALGIERGTDGLVYSDRADARKLRAAIMRPHAKP